jgi:Mrp family chromosome partitioning ATPase
MGKHKGLNELLEGSCNASEAVRAGEPAQLHVLPAGRRSDQFSDNLVMRAAQDRLRSLFAQYDEVIVDSAPVLAGSSSVILATLVDEVILVLRAGHSRTDETRAAHEHLMSVGGRVVGVILNGVDERTARYSYSYSYAHAPASGEDSA